MNVVILSGNLAADPEVRFTPTGKAVTEATICVTERWTDDAGQRQEKTAFVGLVFWGNRGEVFAKYHRKGSRASIRGKLFQDRWEDRTTGKKQSKTRVQVEEWEFADRKPNDPADPPDNPGLVRPKTKESNPADAPPADGGADDDVPF